MLRHAVLLLFVLMPATALGEVPRVAADVAPVHSLASRVMQGIGPVDLVVRPGASPHGYAMRPSEARALDAADVVFVLGRGLMPWLDRPLATLAGDATVVELIELPGTVRLAVRETVLFGGEDSTPVQAGADGSDSMVGQDEHGQKGHEGHEDHGNEDDGHGHAHGPHGLDPHAWLDPENGKLWLGAMAETLAARDPANAARYRRNARAGQAEIDDLTARLRAMLAPHRAARYVVFHDAYQYFEARFGLRAVGAISPSDATSPGPARLARLRAELAKNRVACVFAEPQFAPGLIAAVAGTGPDAPAIAVLDPIGSALRPGPEFYPALLEDLGRTMAACLGGAG